MLEEHSGEWQVTVVDLPKLRIVKRLDRIPIDTPVQWYPDETALVYVKDEKGISNLWKTVINSGLEVPVTAIQELSGPIRQERIFAHLGWRQQDADWVYLHGGGALGATGAVAGTQPRRPSRSLPERR
jgi:hypothetical protein